jgi:hypothetical protein
VSVCVLRLHIPNTSYFSANYSKIGLDLVLK